MELDFSSQSHFLFALLPEIILSVWGMIVLVAGVWKKEGGPSAHDLGLVSLVGILLAAGANGRRSILYTNEHAIPGVPDACPEDECEGVTEAEGLW